MLFSKDVTNGHLELKVLSNEHSNCCESYQANSSRLYSQKFRGKISRKNQAIDKEGITETERKRLFLSNLESEIEKRVSKIKAET